MQTGESKRGGWQTVVLGLACVGVSILADALFLPRQSLWNDEATQMAGLTLSPVGMTRWLAGREFHDFGVPDDRMPPLSYWGEWAWSQVFGLRETPLRWFSVACVALATGIIFAAARRTWGLAAGVAAGLMLATSPNVVTQAVEIRAYALLILTTTGVFACLLGYAEGSVESRRRWLWGIVACGIAAVYTHFFGLVALGGALVAAFALTLIRREKIVPVLVAAVFAGVASLGIVPFVFHASTMSTQTASGLMGDRLMGLVRLLYRLYSHPATSVSRVAVALAALGFALGMVSSLAPNRRTGGSKTGLALALGLISGAGVVALAQLGQSSFEAARPSYNVWMLPLAMLMMASGLAARARVVRVLALTGVALTLAANVYSDAQLATHGEFFAHTPHGPISALIRRFGPEQVAIIHDAESSQAWHIYSPVHYEFGGKVHQYRLLAPKSGKEGSQVRLSQYPIAAGEVDPLTLPFDALIVARSEQMGAKDIARQINQGVTPIEDGPVTKALLASPDWERVEEAVYVSFVGSGVSVFRKIRRP